MSIPLISLLDAVDKAGSFCDVGLRMPDQVELSLLGGSFLLFFLGRLVLAYLLGLLFECAVQLVSVFEVPGAETLGFVVLEVALPV